MYCLQCEKEKVPEHFIHGTHELREYWTDGEGNILCSFVDMNKVVPLLGEVRLHTDSEITRVVLRVYDRLDHRWYSLYENEGHARGMGVKEVQNRILALNGSVEALINEQLASQHIDRVVCAGACEVTLIHSSWLPYQDIETHVQKETSE